MRAPKPRNILTRIPFQGINAERNIGKPRKNHRAFRRRRPSFQSLSSNVDKSISRTGHFDVSEYNVSPGALRYLRVDLLLIDDDEELCALLTEFLSPQGFTMECVHTGPEGLQRALAGSHDLVILDVMLPAMDGFEILRRLRQKSHVPVLMLTARGRDEDRIGGLEQGADDYLAKPFNSRELVARMRAIERRLEVRPPENLRLSINQIAIDSGRREVQRHGQQVAITTFEFDILELLMRNAGRVVSRDELMEHLYNRKATAFDRSIDMHVSHLRRKLEQGTPLIKTIRGVGYQFVSDSAQAAT